MEIGRWGKAVLSGFAVFLLCLIVYSCSLAPGLPPGYDSAELTSACAGGGIAHPPGYPLYTLIGWILCSWSSQEPSYTMNMFSGYMGSLACGVLAFGLALVSRSIAVALMGALLFAFSLTPWHLSVGAEVFTMHLFFVALLFSLALVWKYMPGSRFVVSCLLAFVFGLSLSHHHTVVLAVPSLALYFWLVCNPPKSPTEENKTPKPTSRKRGKRSQKKNSTLSANTTSSAPIATQASNVVQPPSAVQAYNNPEQVSEIRQESGDGKALENTSASTVQSRGLLTYLAPVLCFILGLLPYLWLPLRSAYLQRAAQTKFVLNWGNPSTWEGFWWVVTRSGYGTLSLSSQNDNIDRFYSIIAYFYSVGLRQSVLITAIFAVIGLIYVLGNWKEYRDEACLFGSFWFVTGPAWAIYAAQPDLPGFTEMLERFYAASYLGLAFFVGMAVKCLYKSVIVDYKTGETKELNEAELVQYRGQKVPGLQIKGQRWAWAAVIASVVFVVCLNWSSASEYGRYLVNDGLMFMADTIPDKAVVVATNDLVCGGLIYSKTVRGRKYILVPEGVYRSPWFLDSLPQDYAKILREKGLIEFLNQAHKAGFDIYFDNEQTAGECGLEHADKYHPVVCCGLLYRYVRPGEDVYSSPEALLEYHKRDAELLKSYIANYRPVNCAEDACLRPFWHKFMLKRWQTAVEHNEGHEFTKIERFCLEKGKKQSRSGEP